MFWNRNTAFDATVKFSFRLFFPKKVPPTYYFALSPWHGVVNSILNKYFLTCLQIRLSFLSANRIIRLRRRKWHWMYCFKGRRGWISLGYSQWRAHQHFPREPDESMSTILVSVLPVFESQQGQRLELLFWLKKKSSYSFGKKHPSWVFL